MTDEQTVVVAARVTAAQRAKLGTNPGQTLKELVTNFTGLPGVTREPGRPLGSKDRVKRKKRQAITRKRANRKRRNAL